MSNQQPLRILLSRATADRLRERVEKVLDGRPHELLIAEATRGHAHGNADIAYISREVTGSSTKHVLTESLEAFYESLRASPSLQWVHVHSAGLDRPIFPELIARGVKVTPSSGANAEPVMQNALAGLLALARHFPELMRAQRENRWLKAGELTMPRDLRGQKAVIVGWGVIGQGLGKLLRALGLRVSVVRSSAQAVEGADECVAFEDMASILGDADWLVLACPLTERTRFLVDGAMLAALPARACLINVARGEVVREAELIAALREGRLAGAYLDVYEHEPLAAESPLWQLPNVIATPHSAGHSDGNAGRVDGIFLDFLGRWAADHP
ncbi:D-2-hydroxyacid dehydrogenase [Bordetella sp. N]|uniref:D-2-hydroxyacid dehydrogenase n=1 Tax=Bordetella sp. N TaxID=1746199 RepID=UPI000709DAA3|nr:D-2-hydroxyacid dehydrogenase [Bordetella sp. N]ALM86325.1 hydroxyacid dehydrogenase [Bordetella sp. N]